ncbi:MAG: hypothetical protein ABI778_01025 [Ignavibacteriota bacterium]
MENIKEEYVGTNKKKSTPIESQKNLSSTQVRPAETDRPPSHGEEFDEGYVDHEKRPTRQMTGGPDKPTA